jgi:putative oxidoreductase
VILMMAAGASFGLLLLRLVIGFAAAVHGAQKLSGRFGGHGLSWTTGWLAGLGVSAPRVMALVLGIAELSGGILFALGFLIPLAALAIAFVVPTAMGLAFGRGRLWHAGRGYELDLLVLTGAIGVAAAGGGRVSIDSISGWSGTTSGVRWAFGALALGTAGSAAVLAFGRQPAAAPVDALQAASVNGDGAGFQAAAETWAIGRSVLWREPRRGWPDQVGSEAARQSERLKIEVAGAGEGSELIAWLRRRRFAASLVEDGSGWTVEIRSAQDPRRLLLDVAVALDDWLGDARRTQVALRAAGACYSMSPLRAGARRNARGSRWR